MNWKAKPTPISDTRFTKITTTSRFPHLPLRQKPWAGDHRTRQLHQNHNEGSLTGGACLPTPLLGRLCKPQTTTRKRDQSMDDKIP